MHLAIYPIHKPCMPLQDATKLKSMSENKNNNRIRFYNLLKLL